MNSSFRVIFMMFVVKVMLEFFFVLILFLQSLVFWVCKDGGGGLGGVQMEELSQGREEFLVEVGLKGSQRGFFQGEIWSQRGDESWDRIQGEGGVGSGEEDKSYGEIKIGFWEEVEWWIVRGVGQVFGEKGK